MITTEDLKQIVILGHLPEKMIDRLLPHIGLHRFEEGTIIFREGDPGDTFYMLKRGKVVLEQRLSDNVKVYVTSIKPGYSFGWSAVLSELGSYTLDAACTEESEIFSIKRHAVRKLLDEDHSLGYLLMQRIVMVVKKRLDHRTEQFLRLISTHPDIKTLSEGSSGLDTIYNPSEE
ncbi:MAG: cyclic nucleotide-binding domain-containing protein [Thermodesulfobacteriota bacterium]